MRGPFTRVWLVHPFYPSCLSQFPASGPLQDQSLRVATMEWERGGKQPRKTNPLLFLLPVSKRGTSLGWGAGGLGPWGGGQVARDVGCVCPEGENNTLDTGGKAGGVRMRTFPLPGLGHKPQYKNNLRLCVWALSRPVRTGSPTPSLPQTHISHTTPQLFLSSFIQFLPQGRRCCFLYWSLSPHSSKASPVCPQPWPSLSLGPA